MSERPDVQAERQEWVRQHGGGRVTASDLAVRYQAETGVEVSGRTIRRDFMSMGARRVGKDTWLLPPAGLDGPSDGEAE